MERETKEIIKLTAFQILSVVEDKLDGVAFSVGSPSKALFRQNWPETALDWSDFRQKIYRLKRQGMIRKAIAGKKYYLEITDKGKKRLKELEIEQLAVKRPGKWDQKWRIIIFDVPEKWLGIRNGFRRGLYHLGFKQIQKSVFVYPFECDKEIGMLCDFYGARQYIKYMIADIIEGEESIIEHFIDKGVLTEDDLKN